MSPAPPGRRGVLRGALAAAAVAASGVRAWGAATVTPARARPAVPHGVQVGEVAADRAVVWSATDRPARMQVEYATTERFADARRVDGPVAGPASAYTARVVLTGLPPGQEIFYRVTFLDLADLRTASLPAAGRFRTAPRDARDVTFTWSGDTAGQGWGIDPAWGGMRLYEVLRRTDPDFFVHAGDLVYADNPLPAEVPLPGGGTWRNVVTEAKAKVAETLDEFRGQYTYNLLDEHVRRFNAAVAQYVQWDDHDVTDNWFPGRRLDADPRYGVKSASVLAARARQAMAEWTPILPHPGDPGRVYRVVHRGPLLDLFLLDPRSHRGPNGENREARLTDAARLLGRTQAAWLASALRASRATWKVVVAGQPLGLVIHDDFRRAWGSDAVAQGDPGPPRGRELELAELLRFIRRHRIRNVVWLAADVHYCATHHYDPARARVSDFDPFYEFVSGPLHAGAFGPNPLDPTFGPRVVFARTPAAPNAPPTAGHLHFGHVRIEGRTGVLTVSHRDLSGAVLHAIELPPAA
jgi:alkaline phosphatase D